MAKEQGAVGSFGHTSPSGESMSDRIEKCGMWESTIGENIAYGTDKGQDIVLQLIVDDGVSSRGHRDNIFNTAYLLMGSGSSKHTNLRSLTVIDYAGGFNSNGKCPLSKAK